MGKATLVDDQNLDFPPILEKEIKLQEAASIYKRPTWKSWSASPMSIMLMTNNQVTAGARMHARENQ